MYERFYELRERPFALSPDPDYLYPSRVHREALDYLRRFFAGGPAGTDLVLPYVPAWMADPDVRLRAFAVWLVGVARAKEYTALVAEAEYDWTLTSTGQRIATLASSVLQQLK